MANQTEFTERQKEIICECLCEFIEAELEDFDNMDVDDPTDPDEFLERRKDLVPILKSLDAPETAITLAEQLISSWQERLDDGEDETDDEEDEDDDKGYVKMEPDDDNQTVRDNGEVETETK